MSCLPFVVSRAAAFAFSTPVKAQANRPRKRSRSGQTRRQEKQSWPCRELNDERTPNVGNKHSRFGVVATQTRNASFLRHFTDGTLAAVPHWQARSRRLRFV